MANEGLGNVFPDEVQETLGDLGTAAFVDVGTFATAAQGATADLNYAALQATGDTGFECSLALSSLITTHDSTERKITLSCTQPFTLWHKGRKVFGPVTTWTSPAYPESITEPHFLYVEDDGDVVWHTNGWRFCNPLISVVVPTNLGVICMRESHGLMDCESHERFHQRIGTTLEAGGDLSGFTPNSTTATDRRPLISSTTIQDEDLPSILSALSSASYTHMVLNGVDGDLVFSLANAEVITTSGSNPTYNQFTGGAWQMTAGGNGYYVHYVFALPAAKKAAGNAIDDEAFRYAVMPGQTLYANTTAGLTAAQNATILDLNKGSFEAAFPEFVPIAKIISRQNGATWSITSVSKLSGSRAQFVTSLAPGYLSSVTTDSTLTGNGTTTSPLGVNIQSDDVTINVTNEATLRAAISSAAGYSMANGKFVVIKLPAGNISMAAGLTINSDAKIKIEGQALTTTTLTSKVSNSGSTGNYSVVLGVVDESIFTAGDYCFIRTDITGTGAYTSFRGCYPVTNVDAVNHQITITYPYIGTFPTATITGGSISKCTSTITLAGTDSIIFESGANVSLSALTVIGGNFALHSQRGASVTAVDVSVYGASYGFVGQESTGNYLQNCNFMKSTNSGVIGDYNASITLLGGVAIGNATGITATSNSVVRNVAAITTGNTTAMSPNADTLGNKNAYIAI